MLPKHQVVTLAAGARMVLLLLGLAACSSTPATNADGGYPGQSWSGTPGPVPVGPALIESSAAGAWTLGSVSISDGAPDVVVTNQPRQTMRGYGGAFNEKGWEALAALTPADRASVLRSLFDTDSGLGFTMCRIPIGASDYAMSRYSLDDVSGDWDLEHFSIERDKERLIPYIRAAQAVQPRLEFWASAWSPPGWLKTNNHSDSGSLIDSPRVYDTLARYDLQFLRAYEQQSIPVSFIAVQNEPTILTHYPSCGWTPEQFRDFVGGYLGPLLARERPQTAVLLGTFNDPRNSTFINAVMRSPASQYVGAIGLQWDGNQALAAADPVKVPVFQTETDCGNWYWQATYNPDYPPNNFSYAAYTWRKIQTYLEAGVVVYELWNLVLDETGMSIDSENPWPQNSAVVIDTTVSPGKVHYTPMFYAMGHFARFSGPGSLRLSTSGKDAVAFRRPDGTIAVQLLNDSDERQTRTVEAGGHRYKVDLSPNSFATLLVP